MRILSICILILGLLVSGCIGSGDDSIRFYNTENPNSTMVLHPNENGDFKRGEIDVTEPNSPFTGKYWFENGSLFISIPFWTYTLTVVNDTAVQETWGNKNVWMRK